MDLRLLNYFLTIAKLQNITRAAQALHMTQPALSRQIKELEKSLGVTLFVRGKRKTTLTEDGLLLQSRAEEILSLVEKTKTEFDGNQKQLAGTIHMGCAETYAMKGITDTLHTIQADYPHIKLRITSADEPQVMSDLEKGLLDFGVVVEPSMSKQYEYLELPYIDHWGVIMKSDDPLAKENSITPNMLYNKPLIISAQAHMNKEFSSWWNNPNTPMHIVSYISLLYNGSLLVESGVGYLLALDKIISPSQDNGLTFRPLSPSLTSRTYMTWKKDRPLSHTAQYFLNQLKKSIQTK